MSEIKEKEASLHNVKFKIETITPMFPAGADQNKAELRAPSIKGLLRFWWRALEANPDEKELRKREGEIFGSTEESSKFAIKMSPQGKPKFTKERFPTHQIRVKSETREKEFLINILEYMAYGTFEYQKGKGNIFIRKYLKPGNRFDIMINIFDERYIKEILKTIFIFSLFGGLGSKSRNGFGGFEIVNKKEVFSEVVGNEILKNPYDRENIKQFLKKSKPTSYPSFVEGTRLFKVKGDYSSWDEALAGAGKIYRNARLSLENKHIYEKRKYIAPLIVGKEEKSFLKRRAKPYFIKVAKEENGRFSAYILYLPSLYCEGLERDKDDKRINHLQVNSTFSNICKEFNDYLTKHCEVIIGEEDG